MILEISAAVAVIIFAILAAFLIQTLCALRQTLKNVDRVSHQVTEKLSQLNSTTQTIANLGEISRFETEKLKIKYLLNQSEHHTATKSEDLAEWLVASIKLGSKLFQRR